MSKYLKIEAIVRLNDLEPDIEKAKDAMMDIVSEQLMDSGLTAGIGEFSVGEVEGAFNDRKGLWLEARHHYVTDERHGFVDGQHKGTL